MGIAVIILFEIKRIPRITPSMLCKKFHLAQSSVNNCLWHLKDLGLVERANHGVYILTERGRRMIKEVEELKNVP